MKRKKRVCAMLLSLGLVISGSVPVTAANTTDTTLPTSFVTWIEGVSTPYRSKTNTTSNYVYNKSGFTLDVSSYASGVNCTVNKRAVVPNGQRRVRNMVYERGYRSCQLYIFRYSQQGRDAVRGLWSPDCAGSYTAAN